MTITTYIRDNNADVGQKYVTTEYLIQNYPYLVPGRLKSYMFGWGTGFDGSFGNNIGDQTGTTSYLVYQYPVQVALTGPTSAAGSWIKISISGDSTFALKSDGTLWSWGSNYYGKLGIGSDVNRSTPVQVGTGYAYISAGTNGNFYAAIKTDGTLWTWGSNDIGTLGIGSTLPRSNPTQVGTGTDWSRVAACQYHTLAVKKDGSLWSWGAGFAGNLGLGAHGPPIYRSSPVQIGAGTTWKEVAGGNATSFAIDTNGSMWVWGSNNYGQLGTGDTATLYVPTSVTTWSTGTGKKWKKVSNRGGGGTFALSDDGCAYATGSNTGGALGVGDATDRLTPTQVGPSGLWTQILPYAGVRVDGTLWLWGSVSTGFFGDNGSTTSSYTPKQLGSSTQWRGVDTNGGMVMAIHDGLDLSNSLPATSYSNTTVGIGYGQAWTDFTSSRAFGTTYTNNTGRPIQVSVGAGTSGSGGGVFITVDGVTLPAIFAYSSSVSTMSAPVVVPSGSTYSASAYGSASLASWYELRDLAIITGSYTGLGYGQSWTNVSGSRTFGSTYTNGTGKPIQVIVNGSTYSSGGGIYLTIGGTSLFPTFAYSGSVGTISAAGIVPPGVTYSASAYGSTSYSSWFELTSGGSGLPASGSGIGYNQSWVEVTSARTFGVTYYNRTMNPIQIVVGAQTSGSGGGVYITIDDSTLPVYFAYSGAVGVGSGAFIVPPGSSYKATAYGSVSYTNWYELR